MAKNLLQIATQALGELGLTAPSLIVSNTDVLAVQCLALLNREGEELADLEGGWPQLRGQQTITLVPGQEAYDFPTDILYYRQGTAWDQTSHWQIAGPLSDREWQQIKSGIGLILPHMRYRLMNDQIHFDPVPKSAETIVFEYVSGNWCAGKDGAAQSSFLADTDVPVLPADLFILGLKWRLLAAKGMNYAEERATYEAAVARRRNRAFTAAPLPINRRHVNRIVPGSVVVAPGAIDTGDILIVEG